MIYSSTEEFASRYGWLSLAGTRIASRCKAGVTCTTTRVGISIFTVTGDGIAATAIFSCVSQNRGVPRTRCSSFHPVRSPGRRSACMAPANHIAAVTRRIGIAGACSPRYRNRAAKLQTSLDPSLRAIARLPSHGALEFRSGENSSVPGPRPDREGAREIWRSSLWVNIRR